MLHGAGIRELRYPVPWHRIEREPDQWDWCWIDGPMKCMYQLGMQPILDPLHHVSLPIHHVSLPNWLIDGFANPEFPDLYVRFIEKIAQRYPWAERYTIVNEPLPTLVLCALTGSWYPHRRSEADFVSMAVNVARAICRATTALLNINPRIQLVHVDSCEHHQALDTESVLWVDHINHRRFLFHDLILGQVAVGHPLLPYLQMNGFTERDGKWFEEHPVRIDVLGLDYYAHSEMEWASNPNSHDCTLRLPCQHPRGFAAVAGDYVDRFQLPVILTETNIGGTVTDRLESMQSCGVA